MVGVLRDGYRVPFHHLPPVSLVPRELSSSAPGTDRVLALQEEVNKMLLKGAMELMEQPGPGFYSRFFLVEKVMRGWSPVIDLPSLNNFITITKFRMKTVASVLGQSAKWASVLNRSSGRLFSDPGPLGVSPVYAFASRVLSTSSRRCASACPQLRRSSESSLWFRRGSIGGACAFSTTLTTGWGLRSQRTFYDIRTFFSSCALISGLWSTGRS